MKHQCEASSELHSAPSRNVAGLCARPASDIPQFLPMFQLPLSVFRCSYAIDVGCCRGNNVCRPGMR